MRRSPWCLLTFTLLTGTTAATLPSTSSTAPRPRPDQAALVEAENLQHDVDRLYQEGKYAAAIPVAERTCSILERELGEGSDRVARCLDDLGSLFHLQGQYEQAEPLYERSLSIRRKTLGDKHVQVAQSYSNLASLRDVQGRYEEAESLCRAALAIREEALGSEHPDVAVTLSNLGVLYREQGRHQEAEPVLRRALTIFESALGPEHPLIASSLNSLGTLYYHKGEHEKAEDHYKRALSMRRATLDPNHPDLAESMNNLGALYQANGNYRKAAAYYEEALSFRERTLGPTHPQLAISLSNLGLLYRKQGDYRNAEQLLKRALLIQEAIVGPEHTNVATTLNNLGELYHEQGKYDLAEPLLRRALFIDERALGTSHPGIASSLNNLGILYHEQGDHERAEQLLIRALSTFESTLGPGHYEVANTLNNLGALYASMGRLADAIPRYERAVHIHEQSLGPDHLLVATDLNNLAGTLVRSGEYERAASLYMKSRTILEKELDSRHPSIAFSDVNMADLHRKLGNHEEARALCEQALTHLEQTLGSKHHKFAIALRKLALIHIDTKRNDLARALFQKAFDIEEHNLATSLMIAEDHRRIFYASRLLTSTDQAISIHLQLPDHEAAALALTTVLRRKGRIQDISTHSHVTLRNALPEEHRHILDDLSTAQSKYTTLAHRGPGRLTIEDYRLELAALEHEQDTHWAKLASLSSQARALTSAVDITDIQTQIPADAALVEFINYRAVFDAHSSNGSNEERYAAYLVFPSGIDWVDLGPADRIDEQVELFRAAIIRRANTDTVARPLYDSIMKPVVDRVGTTTRLFIAPDEALNLVPFDALVDEYNNFLIERFHLHYLTSGRDLLRPWTLHPQTEGPVVVVANPDGANLPGSQLEASLLGSLFADSISMERENATETRLRVQERPRIIHLATHGTFGTGRLEHAVFDAPVGDLLRSTNSVFDGFPPTQLDNPMLYSWLDLAKPATPRSDQAHSDDDSALLDDGRLTAYEISGWDLRGTELVTLSACDTGQGTYQQGEGILGLRRAFAIAGAQTQVMSLWKVSDTATAKLMESYYRRLLAGEGRSEAMRNTQLEMLRNPETRHPRDWAAFVVVGEWGPLSRSPSLEREGPPPIAPSPRACQAAATSPSGGLQGLLALVMLALARRRRPSLPH